MLNLALPPRTSPSQMLSPPAQDLGARLRAAGRRPYLIPVGGSSPLGCWGYLDAVEEIRQQSQARRARAALPCDFPHRPAAVRCSSWYPPQAPGGCGPIDVLAVACGSGGTVAGLALGCHLSGLGAQIRVRSELQSTQAARSLAVGTAFTKAGPALREALLRELCVSVCYLAQSYGVCDDPEYFYSHIDELCAALGVSGGGGAMNVRARDIAQCEQAKGAGYAISRDDELRTVAEVARATGVVTDHVYSGKALHALLAEMKARHTVT